MEVIGTHTLILRDQQIPANQAMTYYFKQTNNMGFRGKPRTTLPTKLDDLVNYFNKTEQLKDHGYEAVTEGDPGDGGVTFYFVKHVNNV